MNKRACPCPFLGLIAVLVVVGFFSSSGSEPLDTRNWDLAKLVKHLHDAGLQLKAVSTRADGLWANSLYLCENPDATWRDFQTKNRNLDCIDQWKGAVWVERLGRNASTEWYVGQWGSNGFQLDRFVVFGEARLVERILQTLQR